jgi:hypothetical protein
MRYRLQRQRSHEVASNALSSLPAAPGIGQDPVTRARGLIEFWNTQWRSCERFSDAPIELGRLRPWVDDIALFDLMDYGADFRTRMVGRNLVPVLGRDWSGSKLSELPSPYRQDLRQILLGASMLREPVAERFGWLVDSRLWSCTVCAMPVAGELFQPTRLLLGVFYAPEQSSPSETADLMHFAGQRPQAHATGCPGDAC